VVVVTLWVIAEAFVSLGSLSEPGAVVAVEEAPMAEYEVSVREASYGVIDPAWVYSTRQNSRLLAREWEIGCISGDNPGYSFKDVRWVDANTLVISLLEEEVTVEVDPGSGEPEPVAAPPWGC